MVDAYQRRALAMRSETVARTESIKTLSEAQELAFSQFAREADISPQDVEQAWNTTLDGRERATHEAMHGQVRPYGVPFDSPSGARLAYPGDRRRRPRRS